MKRWIPMGALLLMLGCTTGTQDINLDNPNDPNGSSSLNVPENVQVQVGDGMVTLTWSPPSGEEDQVKAYAVYRREISPDDSEGTKRIATVTGTGYTDRSARNGRLYGYRVAAGEAESGPFGRRSQEIEVVPTLFSLVIENGAAFTKNATVRVSFKAPSSAESFRLSEHQDFAGASYQGYTASINWTFTPGDGDRTLYATFQLTDGSESELVSDSIALDTHAYISRVAFSGNDVQNPGSSVHFEVETGESGGAAYINVPGVFDRVDLFDDGTRGDVTEGDGVYEGDAVIPEDKRAEQAAVVGHFTDAAGNTATNLEAPRSLTVARAPAAVELSAPLFAEPPDAASVTLRWTRAAIPDFDAYQLFRGDTAAVDSSNVVAASTTNQGTLELSDGEIAEGRTYFYRVFVRNDAGQLTGSNTVEATVPNLRPPTAVNLSAPDGVTATSVGLRWPATGDRDFAAYAIYRSSDTFVDDGDLLVTTLTNRDAVLFTDTELTENTEYTYRIYTRDTGGLTTPGEQRSITTTNLPPSPVTLNAAAQVDTMAATLSWTASSAHDFQSYRLYRDKGPGVGTFSTMVVEIKEQDVLEYRDTGLDPNTTYYYRVFVFDDGAVPQVESAGSNTVSVKTDAP